jgi:hypothetical protein
MTALANDTNLDAGEIRFLAHARVNTLAQKPQTKKRCHPPPGEYFVSPAQGYIALNLLHAFVTSG